MCNSNIVDEKAAENFPVLFFEMLISNSACFLRLDKIYNRKYSDILRDIDASIDYFSRPDIEQYEKCYYLLKVREQL